MLVIVLAACGPESAPAPGSAPAAATRPARVVAATAKVDGDTHDRFAADDLSCTDCHACGKAGHPASWNDPASARFHAVFANRGLVRNCATCHGAALEGAAAAPGCASCHDRNLPAGVASWTANCVMCHGGTDDASGAPPRPTWGNAGDAVRVGAHATHVRAAVDCGACHRKPADALAAGHVDGRTADLAFGGLAVAGGAAPTWDRTTATCASTYCHGATLRGGTTPAPRWTEVGTGQAACGGCHAVPPPAPHPAAALGACAGCHPDSVDAAGKTRGAPAGKHLDGVVQASSGHDAAWTDPASAGFHAFSANRGLAACASCHGATLDGGAAGACARCHDQALPAGVASWKVNCVMCHGGAESGTGAPPKATWGNGGDPVRVGAHGRHVALFSARGCALCHPTPDSALSPGHVDGGPATVAMTGLATGGGATAPRFDRASATCASTYCHGATLPGGTRKAPVWTGGAAEAGCGACHGAPPPAPHVQNPDCGRCHDGYGPASVNPATHVNGVVDVLADSQLSCSTCHGTSATPAPPPGTAGETATTSVAVGAHERHLSGGAIGGPVRCEECHLVPTSVRHADGVAAVAFGALASASGAVPAWSREAATCSSTYCHGAFPGGNATNAPSWIIVDGSQARCGTCHGAPPAAPHPASDLAGCAGCHPDSVDAAGSALPPPAGKHLDGVVQSGHASTWSDPASPGFHASSANRGLGACAQCHGATLDGGTGRACGSCHDQRLPAGVASWKVNCVMCHGGTDGASGAPPEATWGNGGDPVRVGAHTSHVGATHRLASPLACGACHVTPADALAAGHVDGGTAEVKFGTLPSNGGAATFTRADATCASTYCHGATLAGGARTRPVWTSTDPAQRACGACHGATLVALGGAHPPRTDLDCGACHPGYSAANGTVVAATHVDGAVQQSASCSSCHGTGTSTAAAPRLAAPPTGTRGETSTSARAVGAHASHLDGGTLANPIACTECHVVPTAMDHRDGAATVTFGTLARTQGSAPTWTPSTATCAATWCHGGKLTGGTNRAPVWTTVNGTQDACGTCHGRPPSSGRHGMSEHRVSCGTCHGGTYTTSAADKTRHVNGTFDLATTSIGWVASTRSCSAPISGCHGGSRKGPW